MDNHEAQVDVDKSLPNQSSPVAGQWVELLLAKETSALRWMCLGMYVWLCLIETTTVFRENRRLTFVPPVIWQRIWPGKENLMGTSESIASSEVASLVESMVPDCGWCNDTGRLYGRRCPVCQPAQTSLRAHSDGGTHAVMRRLR